MARRKRGGKVPVTRNTRSTARQLENTNNEEGNLQSLSESEESSSGTPKTCNTPEIEKAVPQQLTLVQHKKFGKFRCLLVDEGNKKEMSGSESEAQVDTLEVDSKEVEVGFQTEDVICSIKPLDDTLDITEMDSLSDIPMCSEEIVQEEISFQCDMIDDKPNEVVISEVIGEVENEDGEYVSLSVEIDENSNEDKSSDSNSKSNEQDASLSSMSDSKADMSDMNSDNAVSTVRRSSRIRSINVSKQRSKGHGLVRSEKSEKKDKSSKNISMELELNLDTLSEKNDIDIASLSLDSPSFAAPTLGFDTEQKPVKVKSRWRRSSELEMGSSSPLITQPLISPQIPSEISESQSEIVQTTVQSENEEVDEEMEERLRHFETLTENQYLTERTSCREAKKMICDCFLVEEEIERGEFGCGEDCLNRLLMIECGNQCVVGDRCTNKRFQKLQYAPCEVFRTKKKGFGIRAIADIPTGEFILEYVGEVLDPDEFDKRAKEYSKDKNRHYYFMALRSDAVIDATQKGNISRFINHSCDPNAETQKWTVNGELRIGFFSKRSITAGEEITFDYQFQRYGKEAQKCYCEAPTCRGWIGEEPDDDDDEDDEDEDEGDEDDEEAEEDKDENESYVKTTTDLVEEKEIKVKARKDYKKKKHIKKQRKDIFEDLDLDEEIGMLSATGVKNQTHTLKLSRLMVRAKEMAPRMQLLKLLWQGDEPCRRLFLDYHGLRLIHGWMSDASSLNESENLFFQLEILKALDSLPIKNKTILQDSKVLSIVEKWSVTTKDEITSPVISDNSQNNESSQQSMLSETDLPASDEFQSSKSELNKSGTQNTEDKNVDVKIENKIEVDLQANMNIEMKQEKGMDGNSLEVADIVEVTVTEEDEKLKIKVHEPEILELCSKLLERWLLLKEDFRIPKKERIKQMKEHEREADRDYKAGLGLEREINKTNRYSWKSDRYRSTEKEWRSKKDTTDRKPVKIEERNTVPLPQLTKHERRQLFAMQVAQEEEGRRRKQQEMWFQHEQRCLLMGQDPRLTTFDMNSNFPNLNCFWNTNVPNNWPTANFPAPLPTNLNTNLSPTVAPNIQPNILPNLPPNMQSNMTNNIPPNLPLNIPTNLPPNIPTNLPNLGTSIPPPNLPPNIPTSVNLNHLQNLPPNVPPNHPPVFEIPRPHLNPTQAPPLPLMVPQMPPMNSPCVKVNTNPPLLQFQTPPVNIPKEEPFVAPLPPPPPVKLPPKWKCAKDKYGRPYYYHVKIRISQWEPPEFPPPVEETQPELTETSSSSESSSVSSDTSSDSEDDSELGDTKLLLEIRNKLKNFEPNTNTGKEFVPKEPQPAAEGEKSDATVLPNNPDAQKHKEKLQKRKREGLVQEIIISPRREEDKLTHKSEVKKYKETKEKLRRQKEILLEQAKKKLKNKSKQVHNVKNVKKAKVVKSSKHKIIDSMDMNSDEAKKIKEIFRKAMATVMVQNLNAYRKPDCKVGRITNTEDFKHLARKLTHFVMLKEIKHCRSIEELTCNESVKVKAKDFIRKYMMKFGEVYLRPKDEID